MQHIIHTDGGSRGNPGLAAIGVVIYDEQHRVLQEYKGAIGVHSNNVAEYLALIKALQISTATSVAVHMDSELIVRQLQGAYTVKAPHLKPLYEEVRRLEKKFLNITYTHVRRENPYQTRADALVNEALDAEGVWTNHA